MKLLAICGTVLIAFIVVVVAVRYKVIEIQINPRPTVQHNITVVPVDNNQPHLVDCWYGGSGGGGSHVQGENTDDKIYVQLKEECTSTVNITIKPDESVFFSVTYSEAKR